MQIFFLTLSPLASIFKSEFLNYAWSIISLPVAPGPGHGAESGPGPGEVGGCGGRRDGFFVSRRRILRVEILVEIVTSGLRSVAAPLHAHPGAEIGSPLHSLVFFLFSMVFVRASLRRPPRSFCDFVLALSLLFFIAFDEIDCRPPPHGCTGFSQFFLPCPSIFVFLLL